MGIQNMALSIGIFGAFPPDEADGFNTMRSWQHSFAVADLINLLPVGKDQAEHGVNHLVGLCHDLGNVLLRQHFADVYEKILSFAGEHGLPAQAVEGVALGVRHPELVSRLLSRIGLPQPIVHGIREFHERQVKGQEGGMSLLARSLGVANQVAHGLMLASSPGDTVGPILRSEWKLLAGDKPVVALGSGGEADGDFGGDEYIGAVAGERGAAVDVADAWAAAGEDLLCATGAVCGVGSTGVCAGFYGARSEGLFGDSCGGGVARV
jgi:hypothetical protein